MPRIIIQNASMRNFMEIGRVVFAGECVSIKTGCTSYNTSKPLNESVYLLCEFASILATMLMKKLLIQNRSLEFIYSKSKYSV